MQNNKNNAIRKCKKCNHIQVQKMHTNKHAKKCEQKCNWKKTCAKNAHSEIVCFLHFWDGLLSSKHCKNSMNMQKNVKHATSGTVHVLQNKQVYFITKGVVFLKLPPPKHVNNTVRWAVCLFWVYLHLTNHLKSEKIRIQISVEINIRIPRPLETFEVRWLTYR